MIYETYCSYEVSNLLQEKGFNQECFAKYAKEACTERYYDDYRERMLSWTIRPGELIIPSIDKDSYEVYGVMIPAPTHQMAMKWLREVCGIFIAINNDDLGFNWQCYNLIDRDHTLDPKILSGSYAGYDIYEEAVEDALKYSLENLV